MRVIPSLTFLLPPHIEPEGHTIVIVPFLALQQDIKTQYTYMGISCQVWAETEAQVDTATLVTPESFVTKIFQAFVNRLTIQSRLDRNRLRRVSHDTRRDAYLQTPAPDDRRITMPPQRPAGISDRHIATPRRGVILGQTRSGAI